MNAGAAATHPARERAYLDRQIDWAITLADDIATGKYRRARVTQTVIIPAPPATAAVTAFTLEELGWQHDCPISCDTEIDVRIEVPVDQLADDGYLPPSFHERRLQLLKLATA